MYAVLVHIHIHEFLCIGLKIKATLSAVVYRKSLMLSANALQNDTNTGQVVNLLATDAARLDRILFTPHLIVTPVQFSIFGYLLYKEMNSAAFVALGFLALLLPLNCKNARNLCDSLF